MDTDDELIALLDAADPATRRGFACDCAERLCERYAERYGHPIPERDVIDRAVAGARLGRRAEHAHSELMSYAARHLAPARDVATTLALSLSTGSPAWEIAQLLPELCATNDDADDERRWMRQQLHARLSEEHATVLPPAPVKA